MRLKDIVQHNRWCINIVDNLKNKSNISLEDSKKSVQLFCKRYLPKLNEFPEPMQRVDTLITNFCDSLDDEELAIWLKFHRGGGKSVWANQIIPAFLMHRNELKGYVVMSNVKDKAIKNRAKLLSLIKYNTLFKEDNNVKLYQGDHLTTSTGAILEVSSVKANNIRGMSSSIDNSRPNMFVGDDLDDGDDILKDNTLKNKQKAFQIYTDVAPSLQSIDNKKVLYVFAQNNYIDGGIMQHMAEIMRDKIQIIQMDLTTEFRGGKSYLFSTPQINKLFQNSSDDFLKREYYNVPTAIHIGKFDVTKMKYTKNRKVKNAVIYGDLSYTSNSTSDNNAICVLGDAGDGDYILLDGCYGKFDKSELVGKFRYFYEKYKYPIYIESVANQASHIKYIFADVSDIPYDFDGRTALKNKEVRINNCFSNLLNEGCFHYGDLDKVYLEGLNYELGNFPIGMTDDIIDSITGGYNMLKNNQKPSRLMRMFK